MVFRISGSVGVRTVGLRALNFTADQEIVIDLLQRVPAMYGGKKGVWPAAIEVGPMGTCAPDLAAAIWDFQTYWKNQGVFRNIDGVVDPGGHTLQQLNDYAESHTIAAVMEGVIVTIDKTHNPVDLPIRVVHPRIPTTTGVLAVSMPSGKFTAHRLKIEKAEGVFWATVVVPNGCSDFSHLHIFHHPSPNQHTDANKHPDAPDSAYESFTLGWPALESVYVQWIGLQHAASGIGYPVVLPWIRLAAFNNPLASNDMLAKQPISTLREITLILAKGESSFHSERYSTSSFSNGIEAHANTLTHLGDKVEYAVDYDSSHLKSKAKDIAPTVKRQVVRYSQNKKWAASSKEFFVPPSVWPSDITLIKKKGVLPTAKAVHHHIVDHCHFDAMQNNPIKAT